MSTDPSQPPSEPANTDPERADREANSYRFGNPRDDASGRFQRRQTLMRDYSRYATVGLQFGLYLTFCILGGYWLDRKVGTSPVLLIAGVLVGFSTGLYSLMRKFPVSTRRKASSHSNPDDPPPAP